MVSVRLKGVHEVRTSGRVYYYAWRGGPRLQGSPGSPEFIAAFEQAHADRKAPTKGAFREIITSYKASPAFKKLRPDTQRAYGYHLSTIADKWGDMPLVTLDKPAVRRLFLAWRDSMAATPRTADMALSVLKRLLSWAEEGVLISSNQAKPVGRLHQVDKSDEIWTAADLEAFDAKASTELRWAVQLGLLTGLRQGDLIRLAWNHDEGDAIAVRTSKTGKRVTIPVTPALRTLLGSIEKRGPVILTTQRGKRPWTAGGLRASFSKVCEEAGVDRTFHDLRRTAATGLISAGLDNSQVAMIMGWTEADVETMKRRYVSREAVVQAVLAKLKKTL
jgi:integrase